MVPLDRFMPNDTAYRLGLIAAEVGRLGNDKAGDEIDRGLILRRRLEEEGFVLCLSEASSAGRG
jgi:hypothetical protein